MATVNFHLEVANDADCPERKERLINGKLLSRRLNRKQCKLF